MLDQVIKRIEQEILKRALDGWNRPIDPATAAFEAGRRQGNHQGLLVARALIEELMKGDDEDDSKPTQARRPS